VLANELLIPIGALTSDCWCSFGEIV